MEIITLKEASKISKLSYTYLYERKLEYGFSCQSKSENRAGKWLADKKEFEEKFKTNHNANRLTSKKKEVKKCQLKSEAMYGTLTSSHRVAKELGDLLARPTKKQALEYHDRLKAELWEMSRLNKKPERLFEEAVILFLRDGQDQKSFKTKQSRAEYFLKHFSGRELSSITGEEIRESLPVKVERTGKPVSNATLNRYRADIMRMFSLAHKSGWIVAVPMYHDPRSRMYGLGG